MTCLDAIVRNHPRKNVYQLMGKAASTEYSAAELKREIIARKATQ